MDHLFDDPPPRPGPPAAMATPALPSGDTLLPAVLLTPAGEGPHPLVVILNGFPGNERNADLAQALRRVGYATLSFHYRGSWGTPGTWSWASVQADVANVLSLVRQGALAGFAIDAARVALVGHSLGGFAALHAAAADPALHAAAADPALNAVAADAGFRAPAADVGVQAVAADAGVNAVAANGGPWAVAGDPGVRAVTADAGVNAVAADVGVRAVAADAGRRAMAADAGVRAVSGDPGVNAVAANAGVNAVVADAGLRAVAGDPGVWAMAADAGHRAVAADARVNAVAADVGHRAVAADAGGSAGAAGLGVRAVVALAPFDLGVAGELAAGDAARHAAYVRDFDGELLPLSGTSGAALVDEMVAAAADWRLSALAERLAGRPVLLVGGRRDAVAETDVHFRPLLRSYATNPAFEHVLLDTDHALSDRRVAMIRVVAGFLGRVLPVG